MPSDSPTPRRFGPLWAPCLTLAALVAIEGYVRVDRVGWDAVTAPLSYENPRFVSGQVLRPDDDTVLGYRLRSNLRTHVKGVPFSTNEHGFRGPPASKEKDDDVLRIAVLGTSVTMGMAVDDESPYARQLEAMLNDTDGRRVEVLNFGTVAYRVARKIRLYETLVADFAPDVLIVEHRHRDFEWRRDPIRKVVEPPETTPDERDLLARHLLSYTLVRRWVADRGLGGWAPPVVAYAEETGLGEAPAARADALGDDAVPEAGRDEALQARAQEWKRLRAARNANAARDARERPRRRSARGKRQTPKRAPLYESFVAARRADGIPVIFVKTPAVAVFAPGAERRSTPEERAEERAWVDAREGVYLLDTYPDLVGHVTEDDGALPTDGHPSPKVHRLYAESIARQLAPILSEHGLR